MSRAESDDAAMNDTTKAVAIGAAVSVAYMLPTIVGRKHRNANAIFLLNLLLGWTAIGWIVALIWASTTSVARKQD